MSWVNWCHFHYSSNNFYDICECILYSFVDFLMVVLVVWNTLTCYWLNCSVDCSNEATVKISVIKVTICRFKKMFQRNSCTKSTFLWAVFHGLQSVIGTEMVTIFLSTEYLRRKGGTKVWSIMMCQMFYFSCYLRFTQNTVTMRNSVVNSSTFGRSLNIKICSLSLLIWWDIFKINFHLYNEHHKIMGYIKFPRSILLAGNFQLSGTGKKLWLFK